VAPTDWGNRMHDASRLESARYPDPGQALPADFVAGARDEKEGRTAAAAIARLRRAFGKSQPP